MVVGPAVECGGIRCIGNSNRGLVPWPITRELCPNVIVVGGVVVDAVSVIKITGGCDWGCHSSCLVWLRSGCCSARGKNAAMFWPI